MAEVINANFHNSLENLKSKNKKHIEELDMKCRVEEKIHKVLLTDLNNQDWTRCRSSFEELSNNSKEIHQMMRTQNKIAEDTFSLTEKIEEKVALLDKTIP